MTTRHWNDLPMAAMEVNAHASANNQQTLAMQYRAMRAYLPTVAYRFVRLRR